MECEYPNIRPLLNTIEALQQTYTPAVFSTGVWDVGGTSLHAYKFQYIVWNQRTYWRCASTRPSSHSLRHTNTDYIPFLFLMSSHKTKEASEEATKGRTRNSYPMGQERTRKQWTGGIYLLTRSVRLCQLRWMHQIRAFWWICG